MHDAVTAERLGIPAVSVMTSRFVSAAELMCRVLGRPDHGFAVIEHPVSSADDGALAAKARASLAQIEAQLLGRTAAND